MYTTTSTDEVCKNKYGDLFSDKEINIFMKLIHRYRRAYAELKIDSFDDLIQDIAIECWQAKQKFHSGTVSIHTYMFKVADNILKEMRIRRNCQKRYAHSHAVELDATIPMPGLDIDSKIDMQQKVKSLNPLQREVVEYYLRDYDIIEIAKFLNRSQTVVRDRFYKVCANIPNRRRLKRCNYLMSVEGGALAYV